MTQLHTENSETKNEKQERLRHRKGLLHIISRRSLSEQ